MKVPGSMRRLFEDQKSKNDRLVEQVENRIFGFKDKRWHYESRVKQLDSFALKLESGRFPKPGALEDFFACTLVVANAAEISRAEQLVKENFDLVERRPKDPAYTHKTPDAFPFDDLRLYVKLQIGLGMPESDLKDVVFELQIKTFLQHAWSIATHDLVYKADDVSWGTERIAYQTKAMLEHAEISIQEATRLANSSILAKQDDRTELLKNSIDLLKRQWVIAQLPNDVRRLAQNVLKLLDMLKIDLARLEIVLNDGKSSRAGTHPVNLSPFFTIIQYLLSAEQTKMKQFLERQPGKYRIVIPAEVDIPLGIDRTACRNAVFIE